MTDTQTPQTYTIEDFEHDDIFDYRLWKTVVDTSEFVDHHESSHLWLWLRGQLFNDPQKNDGSKCLCRGVKGDCDRCLACIESA